VADALAGDGEHAKAIGRFDPPGTRTASLRDALLHLRRAGADIGPAEQVARLIQAGVARLHEHPHVVG
jgi:hypothetical protein